jgi:hypothetical protein
LLYFPYIVKLKIKQYFFGGMMKEYFDCLIMTHGTAFGVGGAIFLLTLLLVSKRVIGFVLSLILMLLAIGASWAINNETFVRTYLDKWIPSTQNATAPRDNAVRAPAAQTQSPSQTAPQSVTPASTLAQPVDSLKGQVQDQKARVQNFLDETHPNINPAN